MNVTQQKHKQMDNTSQPEEQQIYYQGAQTEYFQQLLCPRYYTVYLIARQIH